MRIFLGLFLALIAGPAMAADACDGDRVDLDTKIAACGARISDSSTTPRNRAAAMINRGNAYVSTALLHRARRIDSYVFGAKQGQADAFETDRLAAAIRDFDQAVAILGDTRDGAIAYNDRGNAYGDKGDTAASIRDYSTAIRLQPDYTGAYFNRGMAYAIGKDYDKAIADFGAALRMQPRNVQYLMQRADAYRQSGQGDRATADYDQVLQIDPDNSLAKSAKKSIADAAKSRDDGMVQDCVDVRKATGGVAFVNHCRFDVSVMMTNPDEPILAISAGATEMRKMEWMFGDADLKIFVSKICRSSDQNCVRTIEADRAKSLDENAKSRANAKYTDACDNLMVARRTGSYGSPQEIDQWTRTCEQNPDGSYCEGVSQNIRRQRPETPALSCVNR